MSCSVTARLKTLTPPVPAFQRALLRLSLRSLSDNGRAEETGTVGKRYTRRWKPILGQYVPDVWKVSASPSDIKPQVPHSYDSQKPAAVIDGKLIAEGIRSDIAQEVRKMKNAVGEVPCLAVVLVGNRRDSQSFVRFKQQACEEVGMKFLLAELAEDSAQETVINAVSKFNADSSIHGILVQLPVPRHMDDEKILNAIDLEKDVDGFHPLNMGNLALRERLPLFISCAAQACMELLLRSDVQLAGKNVVVIGRGKVVGLPISLLLQRHQATVTIVHALSESPKHITREADIVISAAGVANLVRGDWLKQGAVVIDVGTNPVEDANEEYGYRLIGDVCYEEALQVASMITPVPGGVGPMTVAMLLSNTLESAKRSHGLD